MTRLASPLPVRAAVLAALICGAGPAVAQETATDPTAEEIAITAPEAAALANAYLNSDFFGLPLPLDFATIIGSVGGSAGASHLAEVTYAGSATVPDTVFEVLIFDKSTNLQLMRGSYTKASSMATNESRLSRSTVIVRSHVLR